MKESVFDRELVRETMKALGIRQAELARAINLPSQSAMSNILNGTRQVKADEATAIYSYLGLRLGTAGAHVHNIPIIGISAAGSWRESIQMPIGLISIPPQLAGSRSFAVEIHGDSMDKLFPDGTYLVIDPDQKELRPNKCYLLQNGDHETTVKCYQRDPSRFVPMSHNSDHKEFLVSDHDFVVIGRAVWEGRPL